MKADILYRDNDNNSNLLEKKVAIRLMTKQELKTVMEWAAAEGWNLGKYDLEPYYALDNQGFFILLLDGKPIGSISIIKYSDSFAFIGLFIVIPEFRNKGYGKLLWNAAMSYVEKFSSVGLYAVPQQVKLYAASKFNDAYANNRWIMEDSKKEELTSVDDTSQNNKNNNAKLFEGLIKYDTSLWGASREKFFAALLIQSNVFAFVTLNPSTCCVTGYGIVRPCIKGYRIGPLYADNAESAKELTRTLISKLPRGSEIIFDIPTKNKWSTYFAEFFGLNHIESSSTYAMFKGQFHDGNEEKCYGVCSLEIG